MRGRACVDWVPETYIEVYFLPFWDLRRSESEEEREAREQGQVGTPQGQLV